MIAVVEEFVLRGWLKSRSADEQEVQETVHRTMQTLALWHVRSVWVGDAASASVRTGISGGERKLVAVGAELVVRPSLLLLEYVAFFRHCLYSVLRQLYSLTVNLLQDWTPQRLSP